MKATISLVISHDNEPAEQIYLLVDIDVPADKLEEFRENMNDGNFDDKHEVIDKHIKYTGYLESVAFVPTDIAMEADYEIPFSAFE